MQIVDTHTYLPAHLPAQGGLAHEPRGGPPRDGDTALGYPGLRGGAPAERVVQGEVLHDGHAGAPGEPGAPAGRAYFYDGFAGRTPAQRAIDNYLTTAQQGLAAGLSYRLDVYA